MINYAKLASKHGLYDHDHSYTPPEMQLLWRLEDLEDRLEGLSQQQTGYRDEGISFSESDLRYVLPKHFYSVSDVQKAIDLAISDLAERYGIYVQGEPEAPIVDEVTNMQISFLDILSVHACVKQLQAA